MKKTIILICCAMLFLSGCLDSGYRHTERTYDPVTKNLISEKIWELQYAKAMVTSTITDANLHLSDGSDLSFSKSVFIYDGNDWEHIGNAGGKILSGGILFLIPK